MLGGRERVCCIKTQVVCDVIVLTVCVAMIVGVCTCVYVCVYMYSTACAMGRWTVDVLKELHSLLMGFHC